MLQSCYFIGAIQAIIKTDMVSRGEWASRSSLQAVHFCLWHFIFGPSGLSSKMQHALGVAAFKDVSL